MNRVADIALLVMTALAVFFPACLIRAIRAEDEEKAKSAKIGACALFAAIVFLVGVFLKSAL